MDSLSKRLKSLSVSRRRKRPSRMQDLRRVIASRKASSLRQLSVAVIGGEGTGRHTMLRRFLDMDAGPFRRFECRRDRTRAILVNLENRPNILRREIVRISVHVLSLEELDFRTVHMTVAELDSFVVVFDVGHRMTFYTAIYCMVKITMLLLWRTPRFFLIGNKIDRLRREISTSRGHDVAEMCEAEGYSECSALMNVNMDTVLDALLIMALNPFFCLRL